MVFPERRASSMMPFLLYIEGLLVHPVYSNVDACFQIADDLSKGRNAHLLIRSPDGPHIKELHDPDHELAISVAAAEDFGWARFFAKGIMRSLLCQKQMIEPGLFDEVLSRGTY